ncbi:MAG: YbaK/EbsC family protein [Candidatus Woesearchaeota archaeon]|nr:YbaK/EbsC family protein [Candidatus Woesearchaeota archaeon]
MTALKEYITQHDIPAEHIQFSQSCHSVAEAAAAVGVDEHVFVKNICMIGDGLIVAIVKGEDRASTSRVAKAIGRERPRIATPEEIQELTGYPCGGTPSFGFDATFLVDPRVMELPEVYTGGGSQTSLVKISTEELLKANNGQVVRVRK